MKFHRPYRTTIVTWALGSTFFTIHKSTGFTFLHIHYYLLCVGIISALLSRNRYALANKNGLTIFYGPLFYKRPLIIKWDNLHSLDLISADINWMQTYGGRVRIPAKTTNQVPALRIKMVDPIPSDLMSGVQ